MFSVLARVVIRPQVVIAGVMQKITDAGLVDKTAIKFCLEAIDDLLQEILVGDISRRCSGLT